MKTLNEMLADAVRLNTTKLFGGSERHVQPLFDNFQEMLMEHHQQFSQYMKEVDGEKTVTPELFGALMTAYSFGAMSALTILQNGMIMRDANGNVVDRAYYALPELIAEADSLLSPQEAVISLHQATLDLKAQDNEEHTEDESTDELEPDYDHEAEQDLDVMGEVDLVMPQKRIHLH